MLLHQHWFQKYTKVSNETNTLNITDIKTITTARYGLENHWVDIKEDLDKLLTEKQSIPESINHTFDISSIKNSKYKSIAVAKIPNKGLGKTINDRLKRASKF